MSNDAIDLMLPTNRRFGLFFAFVFLVGAFYFYLKSEYYFSVTMIALAILFLFVACIKSELLLPFNRLWMRFGLFLGRFVSPIVLGVLFFLVFTPLAYWLRFIGRDQLQLRSEQKESYWIVRDGMNKLTKFKYQF